MAEVMLFKVLVFFTHILAAVGVREEKSVLLPKASVVGLNWGKQGSQKILPSVMVDLLLENGISKVKIYDADSAVLSALVNTNIEVVAAIPNSQLNQINSTQDALKWINVQLIPFINDVNFKYLIVSNEPFFNATYFNIPLLQFFEEAFEIAGVNDMIKPTMTHFSDVLDLNTTVPSKAKFRQDIEKTMIQVVRYLDYKAAPLMIDVYPIYDVKIHNWPLEFAFQDNRSNFTVQDGNITYTNSFDVIYDAFVWAVTKAGAPNMKIIVGQIGWATDGSPSANVSAAERFYKGFLKKLADEKGTPLRPGPIEAYIYNILDENRAFTSRGAYQRHWGIYKYDGSPKFKIDFSGGEREIYPMEATGGLLYLPGRWCVFNGNTSNMTKVMENFDFACSKADCTSLVYGGSCNNLDFNGNISYAFNMYFQMKSQRLNADACQFDGLAEVSLNNASQADCLFPLQIVTYNSAAEHGDWNSVLIQMLPLLFLVIFSTF